MTTAVNVMVRHCMQIQIGICAVVFLKRKKERKVLLCCTVILHDRHTHTGEEQMEWTKKMTLGTAAS